MTSRTRRTTAGLAASALVASGLSFATFTPMAHADALVCTDPASTIDVFAFNDFHGRVEGAAALFTPVEAARTANGDDGVLLISSGDNIGGSTFVSMSQDDVPTLDVLKAIEVDSVTVGNHEFDKGWSDLKDRVIPQMDGMAFLGANVYTAGTTTVAPGLKASTIVQKGGLDIAIVGAVTGDLATLVSPDGISALTIGDPVAAVNREVAALKANPDVDVIIASFHEGAPDGNQTIDQNIAESGRFAQIANDLDADVDVILNAHTHQKYTWTNKNGTPVLQAGEYAGNLNTFTLGVSAADEYCGLVGTPAVVPAPKPENAGTSPRLTLIKDIVAKAVAEADVVGSQVVGFANKAVSTPANGGNGKRDVESPLSNMVAEMFYEVLGNGNTEFIGVQNPGGTRASIDRGSITYKEANEVLPFANTLMTTDLTGAQVKKMLEQQWQRTKDDKPIDPTPSRPFLALGLSKNVSYTMDESREWGDRITSLKINGKPIDPAKTYTVGSGSFLITGGDNFWEVGKGTNRVDTGRVDLEAWVGWLKEGDAISPDYTKRGVNLTGGADTLTEGAAGVDFTLGKPLEGGLQIDTLDMLLDPEGAKVSPQLPNTSVVATINGVEVGKGTVTDGVSTVKVAIAKGAKIAAGAQTLTFTVQPSGTVVTKQVTVKKAAVPPTTPPPTTEPTPPKRPDTIYTTPGVHRVNGRIWVTSCEPYSQTERCRTDIWATQIKLVNGKYTQVNDFVFNNLTYLPSKRSLWTGNPLATPGDHTVNGRKWRTECDTPTTGRNGCRSYIMATVIEATPSGYRQVDKYILNNIVMFS